MRIQEKGQVGLGQGGSPEETLEMGQEREEEGSTGEVLEKEQGGTRRF